MIYQQKVNVNIENIEGIGASYAGILYQVGDCSMKRLLMVSGPVEGRKDRVARNGLSAKLILERVDHADLMRVRGVSEECTDFLEAAGGDTVKERYNTVQKAR